MPHLFVERSQSTPSLAIKILHLPFSLVKVKSSWLLLRPIHWEDKTRGRQLPCSIGTSSEPKKHSSATMEATPRDQAEAKPAPGGEVTLRKFELSDVDAYMVWASDPQVAAPCRWDAYESTEPLLAFIRDVVLPHPWFRAICVDGHPVGGLSVTPSADPCRAELGYVLARAYWGRGVATAAVKRAVATVFAEVEGLERVEALVDVANPASQRVLEKAGFTREAVLRKYCLVKGVVKDMVMFSFIDTDPLVE